jgi:hypothetical protein
MRALSVTEGDGRLSKIGRFDSAFAAVRQPRTGQYHAAEGRTT